MTPFNQAMHPGIKAALLAALLFGAATPLAKPLLTGNSPWLIAGLLYLGSGLGLTLVRRLRPGPRVVLPRAELRWFAGAVACGGIIAPVLLMFGLTHMAAADASLLLNAEGVFTALLAWFAFKENVDRRIVCGMLAIVAGAAVLSWPATLELQRLWPSLAVLGACLAWGLDNNLTRKVSLNDASWIAAVKGLVAGGTNFALALLLGAQLPSWPVIGGAMTIGLLAYGVSLTLFIVALRHLGTARTGAYFSVAPFFGALLAVLMGEPMTLPLLAAGALMAFGIWLHLSERHEHVHRHEPMEHEHEHTHDEHHAHAHPWPVAAGTRHSHAHRHAPLEHAHQHFPDMHHRHQH